MLSSDPAVARRPRVLVSAFACGPRWGSEVGMGWNWVTHLAQRCDLTVITEESFRKDIDCDAVALELRDHLRFEYLDIGEEARRSFWHQGDWRFYGAYRGWQKLALERAKSLVTQSRFDLVHQLNMIGYREPGYLSKLPLPFVWGPVGGHEQMPWRFIPALGWKAAPYQIARNVLNAIQARTSIRVRKAAKAAAEVIAATPANQSALREIHGVQSTLIVETGTKAVTYTPKLQPFDGTRLLRVSWCAKFLASKALPIALRAIALASREIPLELTIIGDGREREPWRRLGRDLGVDGHCRWVGAVGHEDAQRMIAESDVMLLTSVQEATTTVVMEALSAGVPVLCHDTCGFGSVVDETCGIKIPLTNPRASVRGFAESLVRMSRQPELVTRLSQGAVKRAADFTWERKVEAVMEIYGRILERSQLSGAQEMTNDVAHS